MPDTNFKQYLDLHVTAIRALNLSNLEAGEVVVRRWPWKKTSQGWIAQRGITVHPLQEQEGLGSNERDDIGYGVGLTMVLGPDHAGYENVNLIPSWREAIRKNLNHQRLAVATPGDNTLDCLITHGKLNVPRDLEQHEVSTLVSWSWMRESRT